MKRLLVAVAVSLSLFAGISQARVAEAVPPVTDNQSKIYWANNTNDTIQKSNIDGTDIETIRFRKDTYVFGLAVDATDGKIYWTELAFDVTHTVVVFRGIMRANLDGSNVEIFLTEADGVVHPAEVQLDIAGGKIYWTDAGNQFVGGRIHRANLDGTNVELLIDIISLRAPDYSAANGYEFTQVWGFALDMANGRIYWTDFFARDIHSSDLDGSNVVQLVTGLSGARGIALDVVGDKMYFVTGDFGNEVKRANLDGSGEEVIIDKDLGTRLKNPFQIELDTASNHLYFTDMDEGLIYRANLDGSNVVPVVEQTFLKKGKVKPEEILGLDLNIVDVNPDVPQTGSDLEITLAATPDAVVVGDSLAHTIRVTNLGPDTANGIAVKETLPATVTIQSVPAGCSVLNNIVSCDFAQLAVNEVVTLSISLTADAAGDITSSATVVGIENDPVPGNNAVSLNTTVAAPNTGIAVDLLGSFTKVRFKSVQDGEQLEFGVDVANAGVNPVINAINVDAYLSTDQILDTGTDTLLETWSIQELTGGQIESLKSKLILPGPIDGLYILVVVDPDDAIMETDETNNIAVSQIQ